MPPEQLRALGGDPGQLFVLFSEWLCIFEDGKLCGKSFGLFKQLFEQLIVIANLWRRRGSLQCFQSRLELLSESSSWRRERNSSTFRPASENDLVMRSASMGWRAAASIFVAGLAFVCATALPDRSRKIAVAKIHRAWSTGLLSACFT